MPDDNEWLFGVLAAVVALIGLFLAALAQDLGMNLFGWGLTIFGVSFAYWAIKRHFDRKEAAGS